MQIYTLNVGQGQLVVVTGDTQAIIIDTYVPLNPSNDIVNVKGALAQILQGKELVGLMVRSGTARLNNFPRFISGFQAGCER